MNQKRATSVAFFFLMYLAPGHYSLGLAQEAVYRCGTEYTNDAARAKQEKCKLLDSGALVTIPSHQRALTVTQSRAAAASNHTFRSPSPVTATPRLAEQQARDADSKAIIQSELKKTERQLADLRKQYAGLASAQDADRKLVLQQQIARAEADIASLQRELKR
ncbi:MAG: hypothetical protein QM533_02510 [Cytophagales bacterium]|nr:hypothetical protein [Cytophagales bacterium]